VSTQLKQGALLVLKTYVISTWSPSLDEFKGQLFLDGEHKERLRKDILGLATSSETERKVRNAASYVVSKIAIADFPEDWPTLLPTLLEVLEKGNDEQVYGALKVLGDLVEDALNDDQFFKVARDLVKVVYDIASGDTRKSTLRALAISVFRSSVNMLEMLKEGHKAAVSAFADEALNVWIPLFMKILNTPLPETPKDLDNESAERDAYRGFLTLKAQVVKTLMKLRLAFPTLLSPQSPALFQSTWHELSSLQLAYNQMQIDDDQQGHLADSDGLPFSIDFLILEEIDFLNACLRAPPVRKQLEQQLSSPSATDSVDWITEVLKITVTYAQVSAEEEGLWDFDINVFLSEENGVTANYTARSACGDLVIKLGEWLRVPVLERLFTYATNVFGTAQTWKPKESALFLIGQILIDMAETEVELSATLATSFLALANHAAESQESPFLQGRGYSVASLIAKISGSALDEFKPILFKQTLQAVVTSESDIVRILCIGALQAYLQALPSHITLPEQGRIINIISEFYNAQDPNELADNEDLIVSLVETLRDTIMLDVKVCIGEGQALMLLFTIASHSARSMQLSDLTLETFLDATEKIVELGPHAYLELSSRVIPSLTGAFDVASITEENALANLAADLLEVLTDHAPEPLPENFVAAIMPKLSSLLLSSSEAALLRPATISLKNILGHDHKQLFDWHDGDGKSGLEVTLLIIDRLLATDMEDHAAAEVGGLAAELVEKAGSDRLGPFLPQLLTAVAIRLATAEQVGFVQSLSLVFARLCLVNAKDVVDFLQPIRVGDHSALQVVMSKWLENSTVFAGFDEVRQK
jgi:hypothetical protein